MQFIQQNLIFIIVVLLVLWIIFSYNALVRTRNRVRESWSDIEVQLKRRYDLIPNLVETVKGYMEHEKQVFEQVTLARSQAMGAQTREEKSAAENQLSGTLKTLFAVAENYPQLKANENFMELQQELSDTENKIQAARRFYNSMVMDINSRIQTFPTNLLAKLFGFKEEGFFKTDNDAEREPVQVKF